MSFKLLPLLVVLYFTTPGYSATITVGPTDCSASAVQSAVTSAANGDIVELTCTGTVSWTSTITIPNTKGVTLRVANATNTPKGSANHPLTITSTAAANPNIYINCANGFFSRVSGFKFTTSGNPSNGSINVRGNGQDCFRIDNNIWDGFEFGHADLEGIITVGGRGTGTYTNGVLYGLIDNNTMRNSCFDDGYCIIVQEPYQYGGSGFAYSGRNSWERAFAFGSADFTFIEDNLIETLTVYARHFIVGIRGGRYVARYNTFTSNIAGAGQTEQIDAHGHCICDGIGMGTRGGEIYGNTHSGSEVNVFHLLRGGTWLVYDNTFSSTPDTTYMAIEEYRAKNHADCTTTCVSDPNWDSDTQTDYPAKYPMSQQVGAAFSTQAGVAPTAVPSYFWNNVRTGQGNQAPVIEATGAQDDFIQFDRDVFHSASQPAALSSYTPYTYPHPLRGESTPSPRFSPSLNLRLAERKNDEIH